jgi:aryl-alcohol dehydrogenase-like predicted oxidoreductase
MEYIELPGLGATVSRIGAGCWTIGGPAVNAGTPIGWDGVNDTDAHEGLIRAYDLGVTLFDTADVYGMGRSERLVGRLLRDVPRDSVVISSKGGYFAGTAGHPYLKRQLRHQFATTLDNLGTGHLDVYHLHSGDFGPGDMHLAQAVQVMTQLRERGLVRAIGMRAPHRFAVEWASAPGHPGSAQARRFLTLFDAVRPDLLTVRHNLLAEPYGPGETDVFAFARARGVGVLVKQVLGQGLLLGTRRARQNAGFSAADHRSRKPTAPALLDLVETAVNRIAQRFGPARSDLARAAIRYALHNAPDAVALVGFRDADQISTSLARADEPLTGKEVDYLNHVMSPVRARLAETRPGQPSHQQN